MGTAENKALVRGMYEGGPAAIAAGMSDDVRVTCIGSTQLSGTFNGTRELMEKVGPFYAQMESFGDNVIDNIIAEGDHVVMQMHAVGRRTKLGKDYNNTYCMVFKVLDGKVREIHEYCDTELLRSAFSP